ncbi:hypothetical protein V2J09_000642 [Rumex salicifolius]
MDINDPCVPPGFRFHPTEEELVGYYLRRKINSLSIDLDVIVDIDLYRIEPWDIQDRCKLKYAEQNEWYFFSHKDKKYPTGTRTNRATAAGFWKATGRDKAVLSKNKIIGMRKTLVFYEGRAPNGKKSDWIMHEYRLQTSQHAPTQASLPTFCVWHEEGWVVCRAFKKPSPSSQRPYGFDPFWQNHNPNYYHQQQQLQMMRNNSTSSHNAASPSSLPDLMSPNSITMDSSSSYNQPTSTNMTPYHHYNHQLPSFEFDQQSGPSLEFTSQNTDNNLALNRLLEIPSLSASLGSYNQEGFLPTQNTSTHDDHDANHLYDDEYKSNTNWKFLDGLFACDQIPASSISIPSSQMALLDDHNNEYHQVLNPDQLNDQVGDYLTCFTNL